MTTATELNPDTDVEDEGEDEETVAAQYNGIMVTSTPEFKVALKAFADGQDKSLSAIVREVMAAHIGYTGPMTKESTKKRKYASEEERAAAQKTRNKARRDVIKSLLEKYGEEARAAIDAAINAN